MQAQRAGHRQARHDERVDDVADAIDAQSRGARRPRCVERDRSVLERARHQILLPLKRNAVAANREVDASRREAGRLERVKIHRAVPAAAAFVDRERDTGARRRGIEDVARQR